MKVTWRPVSGETKLEAVDSSVSLIFCLSEKDVTGKRRGEIVGRK